MSDRVHISALGSGGAWLLEAEVVELKAQVEELRAVCEALYDELEGQNGRQDEALMARARAAIWP